MIRQLTEEHLQGTAVVVHIIEIEGDFQHAPVFGVPMPASLPGLHSVRLCEVDVGPVVADGHAEIILGNVQQPIA